MALLALSITSLRPKTMDSPSCAQVGSSSASLAPDCTSDCGLPPDEGSREMSHGWLNCTSINTIFEPSGDQRGPYARTGGNVSCILSLPSTRLRQRAASG